MSFGGAKRVTSSDCWRQYLRCRGAVAQAQAGRLPTAHRQLERVVVELGVVDADRARLDAARQRLAARGVPVQTEAARPYTESLASRTASSASATFITGTRRPERLLGMQAIVWSTSTSTVGWQYRPPSSRAAAARQHARAGRARLLDVPADDLELRRERHRADVDAAGPVGGPCRSAATLRVSLSTNSS